MDKFDRGMEILVMTVEYAPGKRDSITVHANDEPEDLAEIFVGKHKLDISAIPVLTKHIITNIENQVEAEPPKSEQKPKPQKPKETIRPASATDRASSPPLGNNNAGQRMYQKAQRMLSQKNSKLEEIKKSQDEEEMKSVTFQPKINKNADTLRGRAVESVENSLIMKGSQSGDKTEARREEQEAQESRRCAFTPSITARAQNIKRGERGVNTLYEDAKKREERQSKLNKSIQEDECPFKPKTIQYRKRLSASFERLTAPQTRKEQLIKAAKAKQDQLVDPETGQELFKPKIGRMPRRSQASVFETSYLHNSLYQKSTAQPSYQGSRQETFAGDRAAMLQDFAKLKQPVMSNVELPTQKRSDQILRNMKLSRYSELFEAMSPDENEITYSRIDQDNILPEVLRVIRPILEELEQLEQPLTFEEFYDAMERLLDTLNPHDKSIILAPRKRWDNRPEDQKATFKPVINKPAKQARAQSSDIYQRMMERRKSVDQKIMKMKAEKVEDEVAGCSFHPKINQYKMFVADTDSYIYTEQPSDASRVSSTNF